MTPTPQAIAPQPFDDNRTKPRDLGGLLGLAEGRETAFPLQRVRVRAAIAGDCCRTVVEQTFANPYEHALEAVHIFPLPEDGAVTEMELRAGDVVVRAECRERGEAEATFAEARAAGRRSALLTQERADVHSLRVTNIPPNTSVSGRMLVVGRLEVCDGRYRWRFPTVIAPRYMPGQPVSHDGDGAISDTDRVPDASRISPPLRLAGGTQLDLEVAIQGPVGALESSLHAVRVDIAERVRVAPSAQATLNKDFILRFATHAGKHSALRAFTDGEYTVVVIEPPTDRAEPPIPRDAVFAIDISGSMAGPKLAAAKRALSSALHGLEFGDRFRLLAFDNQIEWFSPDFAEYHDKSLASADRWIDGLKPRGGTEILPALKEALAGEHPAGRLRTVLLITDGQAGNEAELAAVVAGRRNDARIFTVGIDTAVNSALLKRLARLGGGACELLTPQDDIEEAISRVESRFGSPLLTHLRVERGQVARPSAGAVFDGRPASFMVYGASEPGAAIEVNGQAGVQSVRLRAIPSRVDFPLGALWARERVSWLEDLIILQPKREAELRADIIQIAIKFGIASRFTAFVAVERVRTNEGDLVRVVQPVELPQAWDESFLSGSTCYGLGPGRSRDMSILAARSRGSREDQILGLFASATPSDSSALCDGFVSGLDEVCGAGYPAVEPPVDIGGHLARSQRADGSFGGDINRTAASLVALILAGNTRKSGPHRRAVFKAARWLEQHRAEKLAALALMLLERVEAAGPEPSADELMEFPWCNLEDEMLPEFVGNEALRRLNRLKTERT